MLALSKIQFTVQQMIGYLDQMIKMKHSSAKLATWEFAQLTKQKVFENIEPEDTIFLEGNITDDVLVMNLLIYNISANTAVYTANPFKYWGITEKPKLKSYVGTRLSSTTRAQTVSHKLTSAKPVGFRRNVRMNISTSSLIDGQ